MVSGVVSEHILRKVFVSLFICTHLMHESDQLMRRLGMNNSGHQWWMTILTAAMYYSDYSMLIIIPGSTGSTLSVMPKLYDVASGMYFSYLFSKAVPVFCCLVVNGN